MRSKTPSAGGTGGASASGGSNGLGGAADAKGAPDSPTCDDLASAAQRRLDDYLDSIAAQTCQSDSDCGMLHLQTLNCIAPCGQLVGAASRSALTSAAFDICAPYVAAGCPEKISLCISQGDPVCEQGQCKYFQWGVTERPRDGSVNNDAPVSKLDAAAPDECVQPVAGAACTTDQKACATCCTDVWSCTDGAWRRQFIGCLPTTFPCGDQTCNEGESYCSVLWRGGELPGPEVYTCVRLPASCFGQRCPTCDCLVQAGFPFSTCADSPTGEITTNIYSY